MADAAEVERLREVLKVRAEIAALRESLMGNSSPGGHQPTMIALQLALTERLGQLEAADPAVLAAEAEEAKRLAEAQEWAPRQKALIDQRKRLTSQIADPSTDPRVKALAEIELQELPRVG